MKTIIYIFSLALITVSCNSDESTTKQESSLTSSDIKSEVVDQLGAPTESTTSDPLANTENISEQLTELAEDREKPTSETSIDNEETTTIEEIVENTNNTSSEISAPVKETTAEVTTPISTYNFHAYEKFNSLLKTYVSYAGKVNYKGIKGKKADLDAIVKEFQDNTPASSWSSTQKLTYWINAYNLFTIKLIVDNYPTTSITKITAKPWDKKFIQLGGKTYSLNNIENDIIRAKFNEPRIHFAVNCASESCPVLLNRAFTPSNLYGLLTSQTKRFLNDTSKNNFDGKEIKISKIFDWYKADFTKKGTVIDFINKYRTTQLDNPKIGYLEYSWDLND